MKTILAVFFLSAVAAFSGGCYSVDIAANQALSNSALSPSDAEPEEHVVVSNFGWLLFNRIPLVCGNGDPDGLLPWSFFSNYMSPEFLHDQLMKYAAGRDTNVRDLMFYQDEKVFLNIPGMGQFSLPIPYLICLREIQFSGVLTSRNAGRAAVAESNSSGGSK